MLKRVLVAAGIVGLTSMSPLAWSAVSADEAATLGTTLTPMGGERAGNADGSIPAWEGGYTKVPEGYKTGDPRPDPFAAEKPILTITAGNMDQYADQLSDGVKALLKKHASYRLDVYPTHRTAAAPQWYYDNTRRNAARAKTKDGGLSIEDACGGVPFPIAKDGYEVMWNHLLSWKGQSSKMRFRSYVVGSDGKPVLASEAINNQNFPYAFQESCEKGYNGSYWDVLQVTVGPPFKVGETILIRDPVDQVGKGRQAWQYLTGQRRVRRAPTIAYDTPDAVNSGTNYFDEAFMFLGALDRFEWKLLGKKEMFIPYNNNGFWLKSPEEVMGPHHLNPDHLRWERHRVYVVEGRLRDGKRNVLPVRRFYVDEDTWAAALYDGWDSQNQLWHSGFGLTTMIFELPGTVPQTFSILNHLGNSYNLVNIPNGLEYHYKLTDRFPESYFSPDAMASGSVR